MIPLATIVMTGCLAVSAVSDRITAADLAAAIPGLAVPAPDAYVSLAPAPGVQRIFRVPELQRIAIRLQWKVDPSADICMERPLSPPDPARFVEAMQKTLPQAAITILEFGRQSLPAGDIEFPASGLRPGSAGALWTGYVRYAGSRRFPIWARVKAVVTAIRVIATADLRPGQAITPEQVRAETREEFPVAAPFLQSASDAVGKCPRAPIRAGTSILSGMLQNPKDIVRGETVTVDVRNGAAHLELEAQAEASGSVGETIPVVNPTSHKRFLARVESKGRVSVGPAPVKVNP
jgi:flagella basal body P-ring formation protein FlgA